MSSIPPSRLEMRNISISFSGFHALQEVDFTLEGGSTHALIGANGAGKSTLMAILSGAHNHYRGEIFIDGQPIDIHSPRQARQHGIHVVQQEVDVALIPTLSVAENIMLDELADRGHLFNWPQLYRQAEALLEQLELKLNVRQRLESCTLAEKQQVLLARALSHQCRFSYWMNPLHPWIKKRAPACSASCVACNLRASALSLFRTVFMNCARCVINSRYCVMAVA